ncbi:hypothetical protein [Nocardia sp. bgisy134]|uniref:hypothetical protein n=1 Tax=unclassified Nocardia TaxID=2637762 RepID=UPI003D746F27
MKHALFGIVAACTLLAAPLAHAAEGDLVVNGTAIQNPTGCVQITAGTDEVSVQNNTDATVMVHTEVDCQGEVTAVVAQGESVTINGASIAVS